MNANKNITANFTVSLNVSTVRQRDGDPEPEPGHLRAGTAVTLTANPAAGWHFIGWSGDTASANNPITITMSANKNLTATFAINAYTLNADHGRERLGDQNPNQATYDHGTSVTPHRLGGQRLPLRGLERRHDGVDQPADLHHDREQEPPPRRSRSTPTRST